MRRINIIIGFAESREVYLDGNQLCPMKSIKIRNHSPDGFNWGYFGSGPAQLALSILMEVTDIPTATQFYQQFKHEHVGKWEQGKDFSVELDIQEWIDRVKQSM